MENNEAIRKPTVISHGGIESTTAPTSEIELEKASSAESRMALQLYVDVNESKKETISSPMNPSIAREAGIITSPLASPPVKGDGKLFFQRDVVETATEPPEKKNNRSWNSPPKVTLDMRPIEVKHRTGFMSMPVLLCFVFVLCEGDIELMLKRFTPLTWLEEWFFYFEFVWHRTVSSWWMVTKAYGPHPAEMRPLFRFKLALLNRARNTWPILHCTRRTRHSESQNGIKSYERGMVRNLESYFGI